MLPLTFRTRYHFYRGGIARYYSRTSRDVISCTKDTRARDLPAGRDFLQQSTRLRECHFLRSPVVRIIEIWQSPGVTFRDTSNTEIRVYQRASDTHTRLIRLSPAYQSSHTHARY